MVFTESEKNFLIGSLNTTKLMNEKSIEHFTEISKERKLEPYEEMAFDKAKEEFELGKRVREKLKEVI